MGILITCQCGKPLRASEGYVGRQARCPNCGRIIEVTATAAVEAPSPEPAPLPPPPAADRAPSPAAGPARRPLLRRLLIVGGTLLAVAGAGLAAKMLLKEPEHPRRAPTASIGLPPGPPQAAGGGMGVARVRLPIQHGAEDGADAASQATLPGVPGAFAPTTAGAFPAGARPTTEVAGRVEEFNPVSRSARSPCEDFDLKVTEAGTGSVWRFVSRSPMFVDRWRLRPTYTGLNVDWKTRPFVKVLAVPGIDRDPPRYYESRFPEASTHVATALVVLVQTRREEFKEFYVNNWLKAWGDPVDQAVCAHYADRKAPYDVFGYLGQQRAPFSKGSQGLITHYSRAALFHGLIRKAPGNAFGYEIEVIRLLGADAEGRAAILYEAPEAGPRPEALR